MTVRPIRAAQFALLLAIAGTPITTAFAQGSADLKRWTVDDVLAMKTVSEVAISPDGKRVAYVVSARDFEANVNQSDIWIAPTDGSAPARQVTSGPRADRAPQWAPDGSWIAFMSDRGEGRRMQVYGIDPMGGEAWSITKHETSVSSYRLSPDGKKVAFLAKASPSRAEQDLEKVRGRPIVRDSAYASEYTRVWTVTMTSREAAESRPSSPEGIDAGGVVWGPDSRGLAWSGKSTPTMRSVDAGGVYLQSEPAAEPRRITAMPGGETVVAWPNDIGLMISASGEPTGTGNGRLWVVPLTGTEATSLTDGLDEDAGFVAGNAKELWVEASAKTSRALYRIPLAAGKAAGPPQKMTDDKRFFSSFSAAANGSMIAFLGESSAEPPDVYASAVATFAPKKLTSVNPQAAAFAHGEQRVISWKSAADTTQIEGILSLPPGYQPGARVPLVLVIHGGPAGVSSNRYPATRGAYPVQVFNSMGYAVLQPNYRGSTGYGARFRGLNKGDIMGKDWIDVNSGVDAVARMGIADTTRLGIMGWSFGGFHTFWGITQTKRFAAASAGAGGNDFATFYSETDISEYFGMLNAGAPWEKFAAYDAHSAYRNVNNVVTPLLIQVGDADTRVPPEQSIQFYEAVKGIGKAPTKLVLYPGQPHGIADPRLTRDLMRRNVDWFSYWMPVTGNKPVVRVGTGPAIIP